MAGTTAWVAGRGQGLSYGTNTAFASADLASLASGSSVMSSVADIANQTNLDTLADVAFQLTIASTTLAAGAVCLLWVFDKYQVDGSTSPYGDGSMASGTQKAYQPSYCYGGRGPYTLAPAITGAAQTTVWGVFTQVLLPPRACRFVFGQSLAVALGAGTQYASFETYNLNLNA